LAGKRKMLRDIAAAIEARQEDRPR